MTTPAIEQRLSVQVAEEVRSWMARRRVSGVKLAERIGRTQQYVSRRLNGDVAFDLDDLGHIAIALDVGIADLLPPDALQRRPRPTTGGASYGAVGCTSRATPGVRRSSPARARQGRRRSAVRRTSVPNRSVDNRPPGQNTRTSTTPTTRRPVRMDRISDR
jgi:DNA-binding Xre family transcriptional regulator